MLRSVRIVGIHRGLRWKASHCSRTRCASSSVDAASTDELAHLVLEQCDAFHRSPLWIPTIRTERSIGDALGFRGRLWTIAGTRKGWTPWTACVHRHPVVLRTGPLAAARAQDAAGQAGGGCSPGFSVVCGAGPAGGAAGATG